VGCLVKLTACHVVMLQLGMSVFSELGVKISEDRQTAEGRALARYHFNEHWYLAKDISFSHLVPLLRRIVHRGTWDLLEEIDYHAYHSASSRL